MTGTRKHPRYSVVNMGITAKTVVDEAVQLLDISIGGASIRSSRKFLVGSEYFFKFDLDERAIPMKGAIAWVTGAKTTSEGELVPWYTAGVESTDALADRDSELRVFLAEKLKERRLSGVRIKLNAPESRPVSCMEACMVKDLSIAGMQIATDLKPSPETICSFELILKANEKSIRGKGRVAYCLKATEDIAERYTAGLEFLDIGDEDKVRFKRFLVMLWLNPPKFLKISPIIDSSI